MSQQPTIVEDPKYMHVAQLPDVEIHNNVPFGSLPVVALGLPELRRSIREWWHPEPLRVAGMPPDPTSPQDEGDEDDETWQVLDLSSAPSSGGALYKLLWKTCPAGYARVFGREHHVFPARVRVMLSYPLHHLWTVEAELDASCIGEIFGVAHDMYRQIYKADDDAWGVGGDQVPRAKSVEYTLLNRARGKYVWGHDMGDLVFESLYFAPEPGLEPFERDREYEEPVFLGTFGFGIGS